MGEVYPRKTLVFSQTKAEGHHIFRRISKSHTDPENKEHPFLFVHNVCVAPVTLFQPLMQWVEFAASEPCNVRTGVSRVYQMEGTTTNCNGLAVGNCHCCVLLTEKLWKSPHPMESWPKSLHLVRSSPHLCWTQHNPSDLEDDVDNPAIKKQMFLLEKNWKWTDHLLAKTKSMFLHFLWGNFKLVGKCKPLLKDNRQGTVNIAQMSNKITNAATSADVLTFFCFNNCFHNMQDLGHC